ncbi:olfactory receptor 10J4-like [Larimichthys crocea]|uniref:olfactory receptor 10J4-like n=1 Tax=Larimichthys crocea TaxID=215358 RepID=UPI000F5D9C6D|nr:olfactory receptor 10J4-like [Larimichthys crocea]
MINSTQVLYFTLSAYFDTGLFKYLHFIITMSLYIFIVVINLFLIVVICMNRSLHEPMYIFLCSLFINELYVSTGLFPFLMQQILSDIHTVSAPFCYLQIFCLHTFGSIELLNLTILSYDRYLAICYPLQYNTRMTSNKIAKFIALSWLYPMLINVILTSLRSSLQLCGNIINKVYCDNFPIVKLACSDTTIISICGLVIFFTTLCVPLIFIFVTYMKILKVCFSGSKQTRQKAVSTCTPHLASLLNFALGVSFEIVQSRLNVNSLPNMLRIVLSLHFFIFQPLLNPLMYGLNLSKIRVTCVDAFSCVTIASACMKAFLTNLLPPKTLAIPSPDNYRCQTKSYSHASIQWLEWVTPPSSTDFDAPQNYFGFIKATIHPPTGLLFPVLPYKTSQGKPEASGYPPEATDQESREKYIRDYELHQGVRLDADKIEVNPAKRQVAKLSLLGKVCAEITLWNDHERCVTPPGKAKNVFSAAFTNAYARLKLYSYLEQVQENVLYMDTDSLIYVVKEGTL